MLLFHVQRGCTLLGMRSDTFGEGGVVMAPSNFMLLEFTTSFMAGEFINYVGPLEGIIVPVEAVSLDEILNLHSK